MWTVTFEDDDDVFSRTGAAVLVRMRGGTAVAELRRVTAEVAADVAPAEEKVSYLGGRFESAKTRVTLPENLRRRCRRVPLRLS